MTKKYIYRCETGEEGYERTRVNFKIQIQELTSLEHTIRKHALYDEWRRGPFSWITDLRLGKQLVSGKLVISLLGREIIPKKENPYEMWFEIGGSPVRFGMPEYALVTGLRFGDHDRKIHTIDGYPEKGVYDRNFTIPVTRPQLLDRIEISDFDKPDDILKCLYVYVAMTLMGRSINSQYVPEFLWRLVENLDEFLEFSWGSFLMERDIVSWKKVLKPIFDKPKSTIEIPGFAWALQWWALEAFSLEDILGGRNGYAIPRCCKWICNQKPSGWKNKFDSMETLHQFLTPTDEEEKSIYYQSCVKYMKNLKIATYALVPFKVQITSKSPKSRNSKTPKSSSSKRSKPSNTFKNPNPQTLENPKPFKRPRCNERPSESNEIVFIAPQSPQHENPNPNPNPNRGGGLGQQMVSMGVHLEQLGHFINDVQNQVRVNETSLLGYGICFTAMDCSYEERMARLEKRVDRLEAEAKAKREKSYRSRSFEKA